MDPTPPPQPAPSLEYATPDADRADVAVKEGVVTIRVPPLAASEHAMRLTVWSIALALLGTSALMRILSLNPPLPRVLRMVVNLPTFLPLPVVAVLVVLCVYMIRRIALHGRESWVIAVDADGILIDHRSWLLEHTRVPFERLAAVKIGSVGRDEEPHLPWHLRLLLRDGPPVLVPVPQRDQPAVRDALVAAITNFCPIRGGDAAASLPPRDSPTCAQPVIPPATLRITFDAQLQRFTDGVRVVVRPTGGWVLFHIIRGTFLIWLTCLLADHAVGGWIPVTAFLQWSLLFAATIFWLYVLPTAVRQGREMRTYAVDVVGNNTLVLSDANFHGKRREWSRDDIRSIEIGGWFWWITGIGLLRARLMDGKSVTLLYGFPVRLLRRIARELEAALGTHKMV